MDVLQRIQYFCHSSQRSKVGKSSIRKLVSKDITSDSLKLWDTDVRFWPVPLMKSHVGLPKNPKIHLREWFFKFVSKVWVLQKFQSTMLSRVSHMITLIMIIREGNIRNQTSPLSVNLIVLFLWDQSITFRPRRIVTILQTFLLFILRTTLSAIAFISERWCVDVQWFHD